MSVEAIIENMKSKFNSDAAASVSEVFQFNLNDADSFHAIIDSGSLSFEMGEHDSPSVALGMSLDTMNGIIDGSVDGMQAFMSGQITPQGGDVMLATKLGSYFPS